jgi:hypothetical protein
MNARGTHSYSRLHKGGLTVTQENAVDLLSVGKNDTEVAGLLGVSRVCVTRWRCYLPDFIASLNERRAEIWAAARYRLRSLAVEALDVLAAEMRQPDPTRKMKAATELLRFAPSPSAAPDNIGPTDPEAVVSQIVKERRDSVPDRLLGDLESATRGLPPWDEHVEQVRLEMEILANGEDNAN